MGQETVERASAKDSGSRGRRRGGTAAGSSSQRHRRLRHVYFGLASGWGFATGAVTVLAGLDAMSHLTAPSGLGLKLLAAGAVALAGGFVVSLAYREAVRRNP
jgi:hypothetical protein